MSTTKNKRSYISNKREKKYPSVEEFWSSNRKYEFFIHSTDHAAFRKFKAFLRWEIEKLLKQPSFAERMQAKYGEMFNTFTDYNSDYGRFTERGIENIAVFNHTWADFLDDDERKKLKNELPEVPKPQKLVNPSQIHK